MRLDLEIISEWIPANAHVLDLGCGDGTLLSHLQTHRNITGYGLEKDVQNIQKSLKANVNVIQKDLDEGLSDFSDQTFDTVLMTQALQTVHYPHLLLNEMLRIGKDVIVTFPNFGHWRARLHLATVGRMPVTKNLPKQWYNTDNIHFCTVKDFEILCKESDINIDERMVIRENNYANLLTRLLPNLLGEIAIYRVSRSLNTIDIESLKEEYKDAGRL